MGAILLALSSRGVMPGPPDPITAVICLALALAGTFGIGLWGHRLEQARRRRQIDLAEAMQPGGIH
jgi:hypothetical protein